MHDEVHSRADELSFNYGDDAIDEGIGRVEDSVVEHRVAEGQRWLSAVFELVRRARRGARPA